MTLLKNHKNTIAESLSQPAGDPKTENMTDLIKPRRDIDISTIERFKNAALLKKTIDYFPPIETCFISDDLGVNFLDDSRIDDVEEFHKKLDEKNLNIVPDLDPFCVEHRVTNGLYSRTLFMPKGMIIIGVIHKTAYIDAMTGGDLTIKSFLCDGTIEIATRYKGRNEFDGIPGRKRVFYVHEDSMWTTVDHTSCKTTEGALEDISCIWSKDYNTYLKGLAS